MELQGRIKEVRKSLGMTQEKFAETLGIPKRTFIAYENAQNPIPERLIVSLCAVHGVNEQWLRTGEGEMFRELSEDEELAGLFGDLLSKDPPRTAKLKKRLIIKLLKLDDQQFEAAIKFARDFLGKDDE